ncbi:carboxypeptidase-like regulatory domain-containing protein [Paucihalobacter ruber]|uniref:Carboxypeptidase-like regulatory domain-containing protein n=1 Tax=Paucihalobacter ruber TaxID=2567861 RepID=A0A506PNF8_9FLAO|nr:carboxypeptidase-like regulatory domain-containing protein [Paucihalobacter ruber]TPV35426.1 carboxypeptidase-like regulatory domain-containing protein [Paucihalobacter ruber]
MMRGLCIVIFLVSNTLLTSLIAQTKDYLQVALKDAASQEPISFATVRIKDSRQGLIADAEGEFRLPLGFQSMETVLIITSIGYNSIEIEVSALLREQINSFYLQPTTESLNEVVIVRDEAKRRKAEAASNLVKSSRALTANEIVYRAIKNIPVNLSSQQSSVLGYYRDYQIFNEQYYNLNEGIIEMYDEGILNITEAFNSFKSSIYSYKSNSQFKRDSAFIVPYDREVKFIQNASIRANGGNELTILNVHNPIRNYAVFTFSFVYAFKSHFINNHNLRRDGITYLDDEPLVRIKFQAYPQVQGLNHKVFGYLLISLKDFSIHRFNYEMFDTDRNNALFNLAIEYRRQDSQMYLNYITFNNRFVMTDPNILKEEEIGFYPDEYKFRIDFTKPIDLIALKRSNFNMKYGNVKLYVEEIKPRTNTSIELWVRPFFRDDVERRSFDVENLIVELKRIRDLDGQEIYEPKLLTGYQFREFFAQEVFPGKPLPDNQYFMINDLPINLSKQNESDNIQKYWLNSPLRTSVTVKRTN